MTLGMAEDSGALRKWVPYIRSRMCVLESCVHLAYGTAFSFSYTMPHTVHHGMGLRRYVLRIWKYFLRCDSPLLLGV
jgi:hypothetical protein